MLRFLTVLALLALTAPALAETPSYNFIQGGFQRVEIDDDFGPTIDGDGFGLAGSFEVADNFHVFGGYSSTGFDFSVDLNQISLGGGYHEEISANTSFFANLAYVNLELETGSFGSVDESGVGAAIGLRSMISDRLELEGSIGYVDLGNELDGFSFGGVARYSFSDSFALGLAVEVEEDVLSYGLTGRVYFGK